MNQRQALVLYEASDGRYTAHRSMYIGRNLQLAARISSEMPYGNGDSDHEPAIVDDTPIEEDRSFQEIVDRLDFSRFGAVVTVSERFEVRPYRAVWFGLSNCSQKVSDTDPFGNGALVGVPHVDGEAVADTAFCASTKATKTTLGGLVDAGDISPETARDRLRELVAGYAADGYDVVFASGLDPREDRLAVADRVISSGRRLLGIQ
jgi:hypothetical protein